MLFKKKGNDKEEVNHHFVFIEAPVGIVAPQAMLWTEGLWWPKDGPQFVRETQGEVKVGTVYQQTIKKPIKSTWRLEVTKLVPDQLLERTFRSGIFKGYETIKIEERPNGTRVDYELHYKVEGLVNQILWKVSRNKHDANIKAALEALQDYSIKTYQEQQEKELDGK